jgi:hypothetical protein
MFESEQDLRDHAADEPLARFRKAICIDGALASCSGRKMRNGFLVANLIVWALIAYTVSLLT